MSTIFIKQEFINLITRRDTPARFVSQPFYSYEIERCCWKGEGKCEAAVQVGTGLFKTCYFINLIYINTYPFSVIMLIWIILLPLFGRVRRLG